MFWELDRYSTIQRARPQHKGATSNCKNIYFLLLAGERLFLPPPPRPDDRHEHRAMEAKTRPVKIYRSFPFERF